MENGQRVGGTGGELAVLDRQLPCSTHLGRMLLRVSVVTVEGFCVCLSVFVTLFVVCKFSSRGVLRYGSANEVFLSFNSLF